MKTELPSGTDGLKGDPRMLIGWRRSATLDGRRIEVHENTYEDLQEIAASCLEYLQASETEIRAYQPFSVLEENEVYRFRTEDSVIDLDSASLVQMVQDCHIQEQLSAAELSKHHYMFYAIVWGSHDDEKIAFIRKTNARANLEKGRKFFKYQDTLTSVSEPDLVLDHYFDLVIHGSTLYMLNENSARTLLNDAGLAKEGIPQNLDAMKTILGGTSSLTPEATKAFEEVARSRISVARRLAKIPAFFEGVTIAPHKLRSAAVARFKDPNLILNESGIICADEEHVEWALDLIEGRLYQDDVTGEERRADRLSRRNR